MTQPFKPREVPRRPSSTSDGGCLTALALFAVVIPVHLVVEGLLLRYMWHRLLVPTLGRMPGFPHHLTIAAAIGIALVVGFLTGDESSAFNDDRPFLEREMGWWLLRGVLLLVAFGVGFWL